MRFGKIITLSLNPVADITLYVEELRPGTENQVCKELCDAAGKAVDVSRVLQSYGLPNTALIVAGEENSRRYFDRLKDENVATRVIFTPGRIRENISIVSAGGAMTRLIRQGPTLRPRTIDELEAVLEEEVAPSTLVVVAGLLPQGVTEEIFCEICAFIRRSGGAVALDSRDATLANLPKLQPWVIKPNYEELCALVGWRPANDGELKQALQQVHEAGASHVLASLGPEGMAYTNGRVTYRAQVPQLEEVKSTVGAGDAALAGFLIAHDYQYDLKRSVQLAAAFGTASCLVEGTNPPRRISVGMINNQVTVYEI